MKIEQLRIQKIYLNLIGVNIHNNFKVMSQKLILLIQIRNKSIIYSLKLIKMKSVILVLMKLQINHLINKNES